MPVAALDRDTLTPRLWAFSFSVAVFVFGFGVLNLFTILRFGQPQLPGLYTFRSATVGDGLLLPLFAYSLIRAAGLQQGWSKYQIRFAIAVGTLAALGGAALQAQWLLNPHSRLNWTLPAPHTFNLPGWYHAAFLVFACGFFAAIGALVLLRIREEVKSGRAAVEARIRSAGAVWTLIPALAFMGLLAEDNASPSQTGILLPLGWVVASAIVLITVLSAAAGLINLRWCALAGLAALIPAMSLTTLFRPGLFVSLVAALPAVVAALAAAFSSSVLYARSGLTRLALAACLAPCAAGPVYAASAERIVSVPRLALGCMIGFLLVVAELGALRLLLADKSPALRAIVLMPLAVLPLVAFSLAGRYFAFYPREISSYGPLVGGISAALFLAVAARAVRVQFDQVIEAEKADVPAAKLSMIKWEAYMAIVTVYSAALLACVTFVIGTASRKNFVSGRQVGYLALLYLSIALLVILGLLWGMGRHSRLARSYPMPIVAAAGAFLWSGLMIAQLSAEYSNWKQATLSIIAAVVAGLFVLEATISNVGYLHNVEITWQVKLVAAASGLAACVTTAWMTGPALETSTGVRSVGFALGSLLVGTVACTLLPFVSAATLPGAMPQRQYVMAAPLAGVLQDSFLVTLLAVSVGWIPNFFLAHLKNVGTWWGAVLFYLSLLSAGYVYIMKNNVEHLGRERQRFAEQVAAQGEQMSGEDQRALTGLARHIRRQNVLAVVALFPLGFLILLTQITGFDKGAIQQLVQIKMQP